MTVHDGVRSVRANNPSLMTLDGTRTFIVGERSSIVIDPGPDDPEHLAAIVEALNGSTPAAILLTHGHADHAAGARSLADRVGAPIRAARTGAGMQSLADGEELRLDGGSIRVVATPGHTPDHVALWWTGGSAPPGGAAFVGDLLMGEGETTLVAAPEGDLAAYLRSLDRIEEIAPAILYPAHGAPLTEPSSAIARYRRHREERIRQVADLRSTSPAASARDLVEAVYGSALHPALIPAAEGSILAILRYLQVPIP